MAWVASVEWVQSLAWELLYAMVIYLKGGRLGLSPSLGPRVFHDSAGQ